MATTEVTKIDHAVTTDIVELFAYPRGTRATSVHFRLEGPVDYNLVLGRALSEWLQHHGTDYHMTNMFYTFAFTTTELIVEVSDRLRDLT